MSTTTTQGSGFIRFGAAQLTGIGSAVTRLVGGNGSVERSPRRHAPLWTAALR